MKYLNQFLLPFLTLLVLTISLTNLQTSNVSSNNGDMETNPYVAAINKFVSDTPTFVDVPSGYWAFDYIEQIYKVGIVSGCSTSPLKYCPTNYVTRAQMAIFLQKSIYGPSFIPPNQDPTFTDTSGHWAEDWIEALKNDGITSGCGAGTFCPNTTVTRGQMAIFLLRTKYGVTYSPPNVTASFNDTSGHFAEDWIEKLAAEGITSGCGNDNYCPNDPVTRDQIAVFIIKALADLFSTSTPSPTSTPSLISTSTPRITPSLTSTPTMTATPSQFPTITPTSSPTSTKTATPSRTPTKTPTPTHTKNPFE